MKIRFFLSLLLFLNFSHPLFSSERDSIINQAFTSIYNENYAEAHREISVNKIVLGSFYSDVLTIDLLWWELVKSKQNNDKQKDFTSFLKNFDNNYKDNSELKLRQLIKNSYQIRYDFMRFNVVGAIGARNTLNNLLKQISEEKLTFPENHLKLLTLYTALFQYFDNLVNPLLSKAKREKRADALTQVEFFTHSDDIILRTLSLYFLGRIYLNIENDDSKGIHCFAELSVYYPHNSFFKEVLEKNN